MILPIARNQNIARSFRSRIDTSPSRPFSRQRSGSGKKIVLFPAQLDWCGYLNSTQFHNK